MTRTGASRRAEGRMMRSNIRIFRPDVLTDGRGGYNAEDGSTGNYDDGQLLYDGNAYAQAGDLWPFELNERDRRTGRTDIVFYVPRNTDVTVECFIQYEGNWYEVIGHSNPLTAHAAQTVQTRRIEA